MYTVTWDYVKALCEDYALVLNTEHHGHIIEMDDHDVLRWKKDPLIDEMFNRHWFDLNQIVSGQWWALHQRLHQ